MNLTICLFQRRKGSRKEDRNQKVSLTVESNNLLFQGRNEIGNNAWKVSLLQYFFFNLTYFREERPSETVMVELVEGTRQQQAPVSFLGNN
jgi:hypothetical protein